MISVISPVYKAEKIIQELVIRVESEMNLMKVDYEIILVEDGSPDNSWKEIEVLCKTNLRVKGIKLSKNYGQHFAITAGLKSCIGNYAVVMDCDLQDNPKYIADLYQKALMGYDIVYTSKANRKHSFLKNITAFIFYGVFNFLTDNQKATKDVGAYSMLSRKVIDAFCEIKDYQRHYLMILRNLGFTSVIIPIVHDERFEGKSSYSYSKLFLHAINGITSNSDKLLRLSIGIGFVIFVLSLIWVIYLVTNYFLRGALPGYTSLASLILISTGLILMSIGILGIYIGKIFEQVKDRPLYFIEKKININE